MISDSNNSLNRGRWTREEHERFIEALKLYDKDWSKIEKHVMTRTIAQVRSHAQKYLLKVEKKQKANSEQQNRLFTFPRMVYKFELYAKTVETMAHHLYIERITQCSGIINQTQMIENPISNYLTEVMIPEKHVRPSGFDLPVPKKKTKL